MFTRLYAYGIGRVFCIATSPPICFCFDTVVNRWYKPNSRVEPTTIRAT